MGERSESKGIIEAPVRVSPDATTAAEKASTRPVRKVGIATGLAMKAAAYFGGGGESFPVPNQVPRPPVAEVVIPTESAAVPTDTQQRTLSTLSPAEASDFMKNGTKFAHGEDLIDALRNTPTAKPAEPTAAREIELCGCGKPSGHGGDHSSSTNTSSSLKDSDL